MWNLVKLLENGEWSELGVFDTLEKAKDSTLAKNEKQDDLFYFWAADIPSDKSEQERIAKMVFEANGEKVVRLTIGLDVQPSSNKDTTLSCGRCFCVIYTNGRRRCEGSYCNANGYCWWVDCGRAC